MRVKGSYLIHLSRSNIARISLAVLLLVLITLAPGCYSTGRHGKTPLITGEPTDQKAPPDTAVAFAPELAGRGDVLKLHFIDVGQGDSILAQFPGGKNMLVDAGNNEDGPAVIKYLTENGVQKINYLVGTHPHEDHIGGMDEVIKNFPVGLFYLPEVTTTTQTFRDVLAAAGAKNLKIDKARDGVTILDEGELSVKILAPRGDSYEDINNYSAVLKVIYGKHAFLLTGDAEIQSEREMIEAGEDLRADVLKVGHHGSRTSTSASFLKAVQPVYAVISAGKNNDYGHPHTVTMNKLEKANIKVYRTDQSGTVIASSDGKERLVMWP
ncbi:MAG: ComEC/Rec2 family competence protein [Eubacteriales bacterium]